MDMNIVRALEALTSKVGQSLDFQDDPTNKPVITISRDHGAGGIELAALLAERLKLDVCNENILDAIAHRTEVNSTLLKKLHERDESESASWLYAMITGKNVSRSDYTQSLTTLFHCIHHRGGVIMGRGAHAVLKGPKVMRIRLSGSLDQCAKRVAYRDRLSLSEARLQCEKVNKDRKALVLKLFKSDLNDPTQFDLVINRDRFGSDEDLADLVEYSMKKMGITKDSFTEAAPLNGSV